MKVIILRGISGVGKSTFARHLKRQHSEQVSVCSADSEMGYEREGFEIGSGGIENAHKACLRRFIKSVQNSREFVVVDNTNLLYHHIRPYIAIAEAYDYEVEILSITATPEMVEGRNAHGVDLKKLKRQHKRFKDDLKRNAIPKRIQQRTVCVGSLTWERWNR